MIRWVLYIVTIMHWPELDELHEGAVGSKLEVETGPQPSAPVTMFPISAPCSKFAGSASQPPAWPRIDDAQGTMRFQSGQTPELVFRAKRDAVVAEVCRVAPFQDWEGPRRARRRWRSPQRACGCTEEYTATDCSILSVLASR